MRVGAATATPYLQGTKEWEAARLSVVGSSTIAVISGTSPYRTSAVELWAHMAGVLKPDPIDPDTQELFDLGHALEPIVAARYTLKTGRPLRRVQRMLLNPAVAPWAAASLDRISAVKGERIIVECKWSPYRDFVGAGTDAVPAHVVDQCQWQMLVTGFEVAHVAVIVGSRFSWVEVAADPDHQADLLFLATDFMGHVDRKERPAVDGSEATRRVLSRMHPRELLDMAEPTPELEHLARLIREDKDKAKSAGEALDESKNRMRAALGDHEGVTDDETYDITWMADKNGNRVLRARFRARFMDEENGKWH